MFHSNHGPISYRFQDRRRFQSKIAKFSPPLVFLCPHWRGSSWNWLSAPGVKKTRMMGLPGRQRSLTISSDVWIECTNVTNRQTNGRRDIGPQQRPSLCIATTTTTTTTTICGDACPLSCASAEACKSAQCTRPQGWGS